MSEDIAERLNFCANLHSSVGNPGNADLFREARDEITRLRDLVKAAYVEGARDWAPYDGARSVYLDFEELFPHSNAYRQLQGADTPQAEKGSE